MISFKKQNVLFITTKNLDYIRNSQEMKLIRSSCQSMDVIGSYKKSYFKRLLFVYAKILSTNTKKYDVVFVGFSPQLILPFFRWKFKKNKVVIDFFISMYDTIVFDRKKVSPNSLVAKMLKRFDEITVASAEHIISDTKAHGQYFVEEFRADPNRMTTLYLEADESIYYKRNGQKPEEIKDRFVVLYFGSILPLQGIDIILEAVDQLKNRKEIYFYIIGPIEGKCDKPIADNIEYIHWLPQEKLAEYISYSDLCLAGHFNKDINKAKRTIPGKAYIYDAMGKKIIFGDNCATRELYAENEEKYYFVPMGDSSALADKIVEIYKKTGYIHDDKKNR